IFCACPKEKTGFATDRLTYCVASTRQELLLALICSEGFRPLGRHIGPHAVLKEEGLFCFRVTPTLRTNAVNDCQKCFSFFCTNGFARRPRRRVSTGDENVFG